MSDPNLSVVVRSFEWFNAVMANPQAVIDREQVEKRFTADARMIANGQVKCAGIDGHVRHFQELQRKLSHFRIRLPLELTVSAGDRCAAYYLIDYATADGVRGTIHDNALWTIREGRIAQMVETVYFEGSEVALDNHV